MRLEDLINDSLSLPTNAISYSVSRALAHEFSGRALLEGDGGPFDIEEFACDGQCTAVKRPFIHPQVETDWYGVDYGLRKTTVNGWFDVEWQGHSIDVLIISWQEGYSSTKYRWILAESMEVAEAFFRAVSTWCSEVRGEVLVFDGGCWHKSASLYQAIQSATLDNLILPPELKQEIVDDFSHYFASREVYERYGIPWKRGVLFIGPPGNGKTHTVKALVNHLRQPCLYVKSFKSQYGTDQANIHSVFERARRTTPCILVLEDLDSLVNERNRSFFLNELDGFASNTGIVALATTNHPERLDPAILERPSRFDRKYYFELPSPPERRAYVELWNAHLQDEVKLEEAAVPHLVERTEGFSFAYLKELFLSALMRWVARPGEQPMAAVMESQVDTLREQMTASSAEPPPADFVETDEEPDEDDDMPPGMR